MQLFTRHRYGRLLAAVLLLCVITTGTIGAEPAASGQGSPTQVTLTPEEAALFETLNEIKQWIQEFSPRDVTLEQLYEGAAAGMVDAVGDPYSQYLTMEQYESFASSIEGEYVGIGVTIDLVEGQIVVVNTFEGSPAESAGIVAGDVIVGADGQDLRGKVPADAQVLLRGDRGTTVKVSVYRPSTGATMDFDVVRQLINRYPLDVRDLGDGVRYIRITQFTRKAALEFVAVVGYLRTISAKGLVLDLRGNPGGLVDACLEIAQEIIPKGPVVELRGKFLNETLEVTAGPSYVIPIAVLVNNLSASASEILAGAIRDRGVGILVGDTTYGKASVQTVVPIGNAGAGLRLTIADYYTPSGYSLAERGLTPDIRMTPAAMSVPAALEFKRPMVSGLVGLDVLALQENLDFLGYEVGEPDGVFGKMTITAVSEFLKDQGSIWQGSFSKADVDRLNAAVQAHVQNQPDVVLEAGLEALRAKIESGHWPVPMAPAVQ